MTSLQSGIHREVIYLLLVESEQHSEIVDYLLKIIYSIFLVLKGYFYQQDGVPYILKLLLKFRYFPGILRQNIVEVGIHFCDSRRWDFLRRLHSFVIDIVG